MLTHSSISRNLPSQYSHAVYMSQGRSGVLWLWKLRGTRRHVLLLPRNPSWMKRRWWICRENNCSEDISPYRHARQGSLSATRIYLPRGKIGITHHYRLWPGVGFPTLLTVWRVQKWGMYHCFLPAQGEATKIWALHIHLPTDAWVGQQLGSSALPHHQLQLMN